MLVKLQTQLPEVTRQMGMIFIAQFLTAAASRRDLEITKRKQFNLYIDEFQRLATNDVTTLMAETRKSGFALTVVHQLRPQLTSEIQAGVQAAANLMVLRVSGEDARTLKNQFSHSPRPSGQQQQEKRVPMATAATWIVDGHPHSHVAINTFLNHLYSATGTLHMPEDYERNLFRAYEEGVLVI